MGILHSDSGNKDFFINATKGYQWKDWEKKWKVLTLADLSRVEGIIESQASDVRVSPDTLDAGDFPNLGNLGT